MFFVDFSIGSKRVYLTFTMIEQALGYVHGAQVVHAPEPVHGRLRYMICVLSVNFLFFFWSLFSFLLWYYIS